MEHERKQSTVHVLNGNFSSAGARRFGLCFMLLHLVGSRVIHFITRRTANVSPCCAPWRKNRGPLRFFIPAGLTSALQPFSFVPPPLPLLALGPAATAADLRSRCSNRNTQAISSISHILAPPLFDVVNAHCRVSTPPRGSRSCLMPR